MRAAYGNVFPVTVMRERQKRNPLILFKVFFPFNNLLSSADKSRAKLSESARIPH